MLASASPRRGALVGLLGVPWRAAPANLDEDAYALPNPFVAALNIALAKAEATPRQADDEVVLAADTVVIADGQLLAKPVDAAHARRMLLGLRGRAHTVATGVALRRSGHASWGGVVSTTVEMRPYREAEIDAYIARGEPFDKAGGYAVQDATFKPARRVTGCYLNVVGLPLCAVISGLEALGVAVPRPGPLLPPCELCRRGAGLVAVAV